MIDSALSQILSEMKAALCNVVGGEFRLILFGSRARGEPPPDSDVDLMVILPDETFSIETEEKVRNVVYDFALKTRYLFSVIVVSESLARERTGFQVFGAVEREGMTI